MKYLIFLATFLAAALTRAQSDTVIIRDHLRFLTKAPVARNYQHPERLDSVAHYLSGIFSRYADTVFFQEYSVGTSTYRNVIASFGTVHTDRTIVGAHYDVCGEQEGADDNASGTAGLLELARLLDTAALSQRIDLVAFTLEEPPFFRTQYMGSYVHAQSLVHDSVKVNGMICLEMIGYFRDARKTQEYPIGLLKLFYGSRGNYITLVNTFFPGKFARTFTGRFKKNSKVKTRKFKGPKKLTGIDFSDHLNYWAAGFSAVMITDTAFYRNASYHQTSDTMEQLDLVRMAQVIDAVFKALTSVH